MVTVSLFTAIYAFAVIIIYTVYILAQEDSFFLIFIFILDVLLGLAIWLHTLTNVCFGFYLISLLRFLTCSHLKELTGSISKFINPLRRSERSTGTSFALQLSLRRQLSAFYREHTFLASLQKFLDHKVISRFLLVGFLTNILLQMVLITILLLSPLPLFECLLICGFICSQVTFSITVSAILISWTDSLYSSRRLLFRAQTFLDSRQNGPLNPLVGSTKIHLLTYIERLSTDEPSRFTVGPLGNISTSSIFEVGEMSLA